MQEMPYAAAPDTERRVRDLAAALLRMASHALGALAARLAWAEARATAEPVLEFHADAGAPEGALYVDGQLVGHVLGVSRL